MTLYKNNISIVVARYNENLSWLDEYPFNQFDYIVYNKGDNENFVKTNVKTIINLPNVGRCDHTYLYHIINNFDNLTDIVVFFPGSLNIPEKKITAIKILNNIINTNYKIAIFIGSYYNSIQYNFRDFKIDHHKCVCEENFSKNNETQLFKCKIRPYGKWYKFFFGNTNAHWVALSGVFSIDKRDIIQHDLDWYKKFMQTVSIHSNPEAGHYIERSWGVIFYPLNYTFKIKK
jgi:hypothetical protein